jgi:hypothetical protein
MLCVFSCLHMSAPFTAATTDNRMVSLRSFLGQHVYTPEPCIVNKISLD